MNNAIEIYRSQDGSIEIDVKLENETVWLTQSQMAELFGKDRTTINRHISNIFKEGELEESLVCAKYAQTKNYGRRSGFTQLREITLYNLDVIISVGYRVKSVQGTRFRQWANSVLKQYLIKGYAINQRIKLDRYNELKDMVRLMARTVAGLAASPNVMAQRIAEAVGSPQPLPRLPGGEMKAWGYAHKLGWQDERLWERRLATYGTK